MARLQRNVIVKPIVSGLMFGILNASYVVKLLQNITKKPMMKRKKRSMNQLIYRHPLGAKLESLNPVHLRGNETQKNLKKRKRFESNFEHLPISNLLVFFVQMISLLKNYSLQILPKVKLTEGALIILLKLGFQRVKTLILYVVLIKSTKHVFN
jgi:hypothetical protein